MKLHHKSFGQGAPVIILHGLFGMSANWKSFARAMSEKYLVYTVDLRDHGMSPKSREFNFAVLSGDLRDFYKEHSLTSARIIGHSLGAKSAMHFTYTFPHLVDQLVSVDMGIKKYGRSHDDIFQAILKIELEGRQRRCEVDSILQEKIEDFTTRQFLMKNLSRNSNGSFYWKANFPLLFGSYDEILRKLEMEHVNDTSALFVRGGRSNYILPQDWGAIESHFPNARLVTIQDAGHWVHVDQPDELLRVIDEFFNRRIE